MNDSKVTFDPADRGYVYAIARRIVGSPDDAEDVTQEALLLAFRHRDAYRGDARYRTWLYRIAATAALSHLRRTKRTRNLVREDEAMLEQIADPAKSAETLVTEAEERATVREALVELEPKSRDILLARVDEQSESDVAKRFGISIANVKIRAHRARKQLRTRIEQRQEAA